MQNQHVRQYIDADPYGPLVTQWMERDFPSGTATGNDQLELVMNEILGTKQTRYGPRPGPESQVTMREVVRAKLAHGQPVPFMVPWGSEKPDGSGVDVAELGALKSLACLAGRVRGHYAPGVEFNLRVEDLSAPFQFYDRMDSAREEARHYVDELTKLVGVLGLSNTVTVKPDSAYGQSEDEFNQLADSYLGAFERHLIDPKHQCTLDVLKRHGWAGAVPPETVAHYLHQYEKLYPDKTPGQRLHVLARYFAIVLARKTMGHNGLSQAWGGQNLELSFVQPVPGGTMTYAKRVHYRTLPTLFTTNHIAPWRAKGYLTINEDGEVCPKLASFHEAADLIHHPVTIQNGSTSVQVQADYMLL